MSYIGAVGIIILTGVLWVLYHKVFRVVYFGSMGRGIFKELFGCFIVASLLVGLIGVVGGSALGLVGGLLSGIFKIIFFLLKWILILGAIGGVIYLIYALVTKKKLFGEKSEEDTSDEAPESESSKAAPALIESNDNNIPLRSEAAETIEEGVFRDIANDQCGPASDSEISSGEKIEQPENKDTKFCSYCGKKILWSQRFCKYCGKESSTNPSN